VDEPPSASGAETDDDGLQTVRHNPEDRMGRPRTDPRSTKSTLWFTTQAASSLPPTNGDIIWCPTPAPHRANTAPQTSHPWDRPKCRAEAGLRRRRPSAHAPFPNGGVTPIWRSPRASPWGSRLGLGQPSCSHRKRGPKPAAPLCAEGADWADVAPMHGMIWGMSSLVPRVEVAKRSAAAASARRSRRRA